MSIRTLIGCRHDRRQNEKTRLCERRVLRKIPCTRVNPFILFLFLFQFFVKETVNWRIKVEGDKHYERSRMLVNVRSLYYYLDGQRTIGNKLCVLTEKRHVVVSSSFSSSSIFQVSRPRRNILCSP